MKLKKKYLGAVIAVASLLLYCSANLFMATEGSSGDYKIVWNADDMPLGTLTNYNGLQGIHPSSGSGANVEVAGRSHDDMSFRNAIKTKGGANVGGNYVPTAKALKFSVSQPCYMTFYAYGSSTDITNHQVNVSRSGHLVGTFTLAHSTLTKHQTYLDTAGTYYLYSPPGSIGVCYIQVNRISGDIDGNGKINTDDLTMMRKILYNSEGYASYVLDDADVNNDGNINEADYNALVSIVQNAGAYVPTYYDNKIWNVTEMINDSSGAITARTDIGGLYIIPGYGNIEPVTYRSESDKRYGDLVLNKYIDTNGYSELKNGIPEQRAMMISTKSPCYVSILLRSGNTSAGTNHNICIKRKDGEEQSINILNSVQQSTSTLQRADFYLDEPDNYYIYCTSGSIKVFYIELIKAPDNKSTVSYPLVIPGQESELLLTGSNINPSSDSTYVLKYDTGYIVPVSLGMYDASNSNGYTDIEYSDDVEIKWYKPGEIVFKVDKDYEGWTGAITKFTFKGLINECAEIEFKN